MCRSVASRTDAKPPKSDKEKAKEKERRAKARAEAAKAAEEAAKVLGLHPILGTSVDLHDVGVQMHCTMPEAQRRSRSEGAAAGV